MIVTRHIQAMLKASVDLAYWAENKAWRHDAFVDEAIKEAAANLGDLAALEYAADLAAHAAAELRMEYHQAKGWPQI